MARELALIHPGAVLFEEFLKALSINQYRLTRDVSVPLPGVSTRSYTGRGE